MIPVPQNPPVSNDLTRNILVVKHTEAVQSSSVDRPASHLTDSGRQQARRIGAVLALLTPPPDAIYTSHLPRARETADIIAGSFFGSGVRVEVDNRLASGNVRSTFIDARDDYLRPPEEDDDQTCWSIVIGHNTAVSAWFGEEVAEEFHAGDVLFVMVDAEGNIKTRRVKIAA